MKKRIKLSIYLLLFLYPSISYANETTLIHGKILGYKKGKIVLSFFSNKNKLEKSLILFDVNQNGEFEAEIIIEESQIIKLKYNEEEIDIYIKPREKIGLLIDHSSKPPAITYFEKDNKQDNTIYQNYTGKFGPKKIFLTANVTISSSLYYQVKELKTSQDKYDLLNSVYNDEKVFLDDIDNKTASLDFLNYIISEIADNHSTYLLTFVKENELKQKDQEKYLQKITADRKHKSSIFYISFLETYSKCSCEKELGRALDYYQDFSLLYKCINKLETLDEETKEKLSGRLIYYNIKPGSIKELRLTFEDYKKSAIDLTLFEEINDRYKLAESLQGGQQAPEFTLEDSFGKSIALKDFKGKKVYISFWAKWCGVCIAKIKKSNKNRIRLKDESIVFVFISIDENKTAWTNHSITNNQPGIHLWGGGIKNRLMKDFGIVSLPRDFLLNEEGVFIGNFPSPDSNSFVEYITNKSKD